MKNNKVLIALGVATGLSVIIAIKSVLDKNKEKTQFQSYQDLLKSQIEELKKASQVQQLKTQSEILAEAQRIKDEAASKQAQQRRQQEIENLQNQNVRKEKQVAPIDYNNHSTIEGFRRNYSRR